MVILTKNFILSQRQKLSAESVKNAIGQLAYWKEYITSPKLTVLELMNKTCMLHPLYSLKHLSWYFKNIASYLRLGTEDSQFLYCASWLLKSGCHSGHCLVVYN